MKHPTLGELTPGDGDPTTLEGEVTFDGRSIELSIDLDGEPVEQVLALAAEAVGSLAAVCERADAALVKDLLGAYNGGWSSYDVPLDDGTTKSVENPELSDDEFKAKFSLLAIDVLGDSFVTLRYDDPEELFWGHHVYVEFMDGLGAENATAAFAG